MYVLGEAHWLKLPTLAGAIVIICVSYSTTGGPSNEHRTSHRHPEEFGKGQKETPCVLPPPRLLLAGIHFG